MSVDVNAILVGTAGRIDLLQAMLGKPSPNPGGVASPDGALLPAPDAASTGTSPEATPVLTPALFDQMFG